MAFNRACAGGAVKRRKLDEVQFWYIEYNSVIRKIPFLKNHLCSHFDYIYIYMA